MSNDTTASPGSGHNAAISILRGDEPQTAANEDHYPPRDEQQAVPTPPWPPEHAWLALDAPEDRPHAPAALRGFAVAVAALAVRAPWLESLSDRLERCIRAYDEPQAPGTTLNPLNRRKSAHLSYSLALEIGAAAARGQVMDGVALAAFAAIALWRLVDGHEPTPATIARIRTALTRPESSSSRAWSTRARLSTLDRYRRGLEAAIQLDSSRALVLGVNPPAAAKEAQLSPIGRFNKTFQRRVANVEKFADLNSAAGAQGHNELSEGAARQAGRQLMERVIGGDSLALEMCLELITNLPAKTLRSLPLAGNPLDGHAPLAWLDAARGEYCYRLYWLDQKGARPTVGTSACYRTSTTLVVLTLPEFVAHALRAPIGCATAVATFGDLVRHPIHHPWTAVTSGAQRGHRTSVRRLQRSMSSLLLAGGAHRWPVAIVTTSFHLVSVGRRAYGVARAQTVTRVSNSMYTALGWPQVMRASDELVGSAVTPTRAAIRRVLKHLAARADHGAAEVERLANIDSLIDSHNRHAQWLAALLSLTLALRERVAFSIASDELCASDSVHVDDKQVREIGPGRAVPICAQLSGAVRAWRSCCKQTASKLRGLDDAHAQAIADRLEEHFNAGCESPVFTLNRAAPQLLPVGSSTWQAELPDDLRLVHNFGRHFWPLELADLGVEQRLVDMLMRHQGPGAEAATSADRRVHASDSVRLRAAIESTLDALALAVPRELQHG